MMSVMGPLNVSLLGLCRHTCEYYNSFVKKYIWTCSLKRQVFEGFETFDTCVTMLSNIE